MTDRMSVVPVSYWIRILFLTAWLTTWQSADQLPAIGQINYFLYGGIVLHPLEVALLIKVGGVLSLDGFESFHWARGHLIAHTTFRPKPKWTRSSRTSRTKALSAEPAVSSMIVLSRDQYEVTRDAFFPAYTLFTERCPASLRWDSDIYIRPR
jgi:hypothetical protein